MGDDVAALIDRERAFDALRTYTARLCAILRTNPDRDAPAAGVWTIGDVANHVAWGIENYTRWLRGDDAPDLDAIAHMPRWNVETVRALPLADLPRLAERIRDATDDFIAAAGPKEPLEPVRWYAGNFLPVEVAVSMRLVEAAVHGFDVATASGTEWQIDAPSARIVSYGIGYVAPFFVDEGRLDFEGTIRTRIRGGADLYYVVRQRRLRVATVGPRPAFTVWVDPATWILVATGRRSQWVAALRGGIVGWGRRPDLALRLRAASLQG